MFDSAIRLKNEYYPSWLPFGSPTGRGYAKAHPDELNGITGSGADINVSIQVMQKRISDAFKLCKNCTPTDNLNAASVGQNGDKLNISDIATGSYGSCKTKPCLDGTNLNWFGYYNGDNPIGPYDKSELRIFAHLVAVLESQGWGVPADVNWNTIDTLTQGAHP